MSCMFFLLKKEILGVLISFQHTLNKNWIGLWMRNLVERCQKGEKDKRKAMIYLSIIHAIAGFRYIV